MESIKKEPKSFEMFNRDLDQKSLLTLKSFDELSIDTEAMGLIHGRDRLCLVQICDKNDNVICVKIQQDQNEAPNLKELMEDESTQKIFHFARFDVAALNINLSIKVKNIFCTKIASKIARTYTPKHGLKDLISELIGYELDKQSQSSDWGNLESLTKKQLIYASNDVRFLINAKQKLKMMLKREHRWEIANDCFKCIPTMAKLDILKFNNIFEH
tara:strand:- start:321 stop:965 length:645 start_codon:yes stop_codon:yes gene_type:complete